MMWRWRNEERPFARMDSLRQELDWLFDNLSGDAGTYPPVNVWSDNEKTVVMAELPGVAGENLNVTARGDSLSIEGERPVEEEKDGVIYHRRERPAGRFARHFRLPYDVEGDKVKAELKNGLLSVTLPRAEASKPRKINVV